jgi:hypothetical protein
MNILDILKTDYQNFPRHQTYRIYAPDVYFKDPLNEFRGRDRYQQMIRLIERWFRAAHMEVHQMQRTGDQIRTDWTLSWITPLPWQPQIAISGWSELKLTSDLPSIGAEASDVEEQIISHVDYWHCSRWDVIRQHFIKTNRAEH